MIWKNRVAAVAAFLFVGGTAWAAPLEAYGKLATLSEVVVSPDGAAIAYVRAVDTRRAVMVQSIPGNQLLGAFNVSNTKLRNLQWADNHTLIITTSVTTLPKGLAGRRGEYFMAQTYDLQTKELHPLLDYLAFRSDMEVMNVVAGTPQSRIIDGHTVVFVEGIFFPKGEEYGSLALFRVDLTTKTTSMVSGRHDTHAADWLIDEAGNIVAESSYLADQKHWKLDVFRSGEAVHALDLPTQIETPDIAGLSEDGTAVVVTIPDGDGKPILKQVSLKDGSTTAWAHANGNFGGVMTSLRTGRVVGVARIVDKSDYEFFDPHADLIWRSIKTAFAGATDVALASWSDDRNKVVAHVFGPDHGEGYFFVDMTQHKAIRIGPAYDGVTDVAPETWIGYRAADGRGLNAYLTLPIGREAKNLPLIVLPHGGPAARDEPGFDWISQALASRGYAVLQPQFRGSDGFGIELLKAGFGEFGKKMQTDLSDGVRTLAAQGLIDPKRVCIVGASYGGYAALAGATLDTGVYRCAVSIAGLSDLRAMLRDEHSPGRNADKRGELYWERFFGIKDIEDPALDAISPIKHVDKVTIPILLIHGKDDTVVKFSQSDEMADALKAANKPFEFVTLTHEDHWLSRGETRLQMLEATVKFLETNNPPN